MFIMLPPVGAAPVSAVMLLLSATLPAPAAMATVPLTSPITGVAAPFAPAASRISK